MLNPVKSNDFEALRLKVASPDVIHAWSYGEVTKPETINYRTQRPEKDGLFDERIFGPSKDWECYCGKYKKIRYKGIICDKCGVEVTRAIVRRERMGHIDLSVPVTHIWFLRGVPSRIGLLLNISMQNLEKVVYFASFIVMKVDEDLKKQTLEELKQEYKKKRNAIKAEHKQKVDNATKKEVTEKEIKKLDDELDTAYTELDELFVSTEHELKDLHRLKIISEREYHDLSLRYGHVFEAGIGAEAIGSILSEMDLKKEIESLEKEMKKAKETKKDKLRKRTKLVKNLYHNNIRPDWMVLKSIPVIPPDVRPMVALDGGRYATHDLNDLYRRVINRNNRLRQLLELKAPEVITRNEKRMLQEAVDALIDNSARAGKTVTASTGQKRQLKSLADMLKGKQGRFRQNLLGKRVDYSGRSVIVVGPHLKLYQCGIPKIMALELFRPFIISKLISSGIVHNVRSGNRFIESRQTEVWDILDDIIDDAYVFLNRAPTLHRLGIQAFKPVLIEGKAIQVHPLVCSAFNADFDGDQMAVHVPLTREARREADSLMLASRNLLKPSTGDPIAGPSMEMIWGIYYLTEMKEDGDEKVKAYSEREEAIMAYEIGVLPLHKKIKIRISDESKFRETTVGRLIFNKSLPEEIEYLNHVMTKGALKGMVSDYYAHYGEEKTAELLDDLKNLGFKIITQSGLSWGMDDLPFLERKSEVIEKATSAIDIVYDQYGDGLLTEDERYTKSIEIWSKAKEEITEMSQTDIPKDGTVFSMINSGSRGSWGQLTQMVGMKGLVANPAGETIELPITSNFKEGFSVLEYFISTHGARKGTTDTALRTASAGYLTRRLVDVAQEVVIVSPDCGAKDGFLLTKEFSEILNKTVHERIWGRVLAEDIIVNKKVIAKKDTLVDKKILEELKKYDLDNIVIRSVLNCKMRKGLCQKCYGYDLGHNQMVKLGTAVGIIAAQSIGEPGTQLTMRTFHTGGVVGGADITQGLPRVDEILEVRNPKRKALLSEVSGKVKIEKAVVLDTKKSSKAEVSTNQKVIKITYKGMIEDKYFYAEGTKKKTKPDIKVKNGDNVAKGYLLFIDAKGDEIEATHSGIVRLDEKFLTVEYKDNKIKEYLVPVGQQIWINDGDKVEKGAQLTEGSLDLRQLYDVMGKLDTQKYIIKEIQHIYSSQGQKLNDKHLEVMSRQMFSRVRVTDGGDTPLVIGEVLDRAEFQDENDKVKAIKKKIATVEDVLLGITKVSLTTTSFLSAASFQETQKVLIRAAISGKVDKLDGLKENVIIGRLIPAGTGFDIDRKPIAIDD